MPNWLKLILVGVVSGGTSIIADANLPKKATPAVTVAVAISSLMLKRPWLDDEKK